MPSPAAPRRALSPLDMSCAQLLVRLTDAGKSYTVGDGPKKPITAYTVGELMGRLRHPDGRVPDGAALLRDVERVAARLPGYVPRELTSDTPLREVFAGASDVPVAATAGPF